MLKPIFLSCMFILAATIAFCQPAPALLTGKNVFKKAAPPSASNAAATVSPSMLLSPSFSVTHLPFFCRQEINIEHAIKIPFKFRLGSVQYVDYLEGKPNAVAGY